jgi:hypothetical protein
MIRISFGIIALNAQPFLEYNLRALYPFAHQLLVVEGATEAARSLATPDGHSTDETLKMLKDFRVTQDPEHKLSVITAQDEGFQNGFWPEKDQMSKAYAKRATGNWLWQVDSDEFYKRDDLQAVCQLLERNPQINAVSFPYFEFFGGFDYVITGKWHLIEHSRFHRLFRWGSGYTYTKHRPPTVVDESGTNLRKKNWLKTPRNGNKKIQLFHYSYVFPKQALQKVGYYSNVSWTDAFRKNQNWFEESYLALKRPLFLGERGKWIFQWLERFRGKHPLIIDQLRNDMDRGHVSEQVRPTADLENLVNSPLYWLITRMLRLVMPVYWRLRRLPRTEFSRRITE